MADETRTTARHIRHPDRDALSLHDYDYVEVELPSGLRVRLNTNADVVEISTPDGALLVEPRAANLVHVRARRFGEPVLPLEFTVVGQGVS